MGRLAAVMGLAFGLVACSRGLAGGGDSSDTASAEASSDGTSSNGESTEGESGGEGTGVPECIPDDPPYPDSSDYDCANPTEILEYGTDRPTGFVECDDGFIHRAKAVSCTLPGPHDDAYCEGECGGCDEAPNGHCHFYQSGEGDGCGCMYYCQTDCDCAPDEACVCMGVLGAGLPVCGAADCRRDDDCQDGLCRLWHEQGCYSTSQAIRCAPDQDCHTDEECGQAPCEGLEGEPVQHTCAPTQDGFACREPAFCAGGC